MGADLLWSRYDSPEGLATIEAVPLEHRAAVLWPKRIALSVRVAVPR